MAYENDEEQIEALKNWWDENGNSLLLGIVIVLAVLFGTRYWQSTKLDRVEEASTIYQSMLDTVLNDAEGSLSDGDFSTVLASKKQLREEFGKSIYSKYSALLMAKVYVEKNELSSAATELRWLLENPGIGVFAEAEEELLLTARLRLARIELAEGNAQSAITLLTDVEAGGFASNYSEVKGDAHVTLSQIGDARAAYQVALINSSNPELLKLKILDLGE